MPEIDVNERFKFLMEALGAVDAIDHLPREVQFLIGVLCYWKDHTYKEIMPRHVHSVLLCMLHFGAFDELIKPVTFKSARIERILNNLIPLGVRSQLLKGDSLINMHICDDFIVCLQAANELRLMLHLSEEVVFDPTKVIFVRYAHKMNFVLPPDEHLPFFLSELFSNEPALYKTYMDLAEFILSPRSVSAQTCEDGQPITPPLQSSGFQDRLTKPVTEGYKKSSVVELPQTYEAHSAYAEEKPQDRLPVSQMTAHQNHNGHDLVIHNFEVISDFEVLSGLDDLEAVYKFLRLELGIRPVITRCVRIGAPNESKKCTLLVRILNFEVAQWIITRSSFFVHSSFNISPYYSKDEFSKLLEKQKFMRSHSQNLSERADNLTLCSTPMDCCPEQKGEGISPYFTDDEYINILEQKKRRRDEHSGDFTEPAENSTLMKHRHEPLGKRPKKAHQRHDAKSVLNENSVTTVDAPVIDFFIESSAKEPNPPKKSKKRPTK